MTINVRVTCINKTNSKNPHERIQNIGGVNPDGTSWKLSEQEAVAGIENGKWKFYVNVDGKTVWAIVATRLCRKYLKTEADEETPDNLLRLPECP